MPTYDYRCDACGHEFELFQSITADPVDKCPACRRPRVKRLLGTGGGIIFKGSGFYETDYRSEAYKKAAAAEKSSSSASDTTAGGQGAASKPAETPAKPAGAKKKPAKAGAK